MKSFFISLFLTLILTAFSAATFSGDECADDLGCVEIAPDENIVIGGILRLSGPKPWTGEIARNAFHLAVLARDGKLLDREIEFVLEDSACSEEVAREAARRIVANPAIVGIIGTNCSIAAKGALPIISEAGLLMISPSNSSPFLTNADPDAGGLYQPGYFRTAHNDLFQGALSAQFAAAVLDADSLATIDDGDPYTKGLASAMAHAFESLNGEVVFRGEISRGATDMSGRARRDSRKRSGPCLLSPIRNRSAISRRAAGEHARAGRHNHDDSGRRLLYLLRPNRGRGGDRHLCGRSARLWRGV